MKSRIYFLSFVFMIIFYRPAFSGVIEVLNITSVVCSKKNYNSLVVKFDILNRGGEFDFFFNKTDRDNRLIVNPPSVSGEFFGDDGRHYFFPLPGSFDGYGDKFISIKNGEKIRISSEIFNFNKTPVLKGILLMKFHDKNGSIVFNRKITVNSHEADC